MTIIFVAGLTGAWLFDALALWRTGQALDIFKLSSAAVFTVGTVGTLAATCTWRFFWKVCPPLNRLFPDLNGTWEGTLVSTWLDTDGKPRAPIKTKVTIRQGLFDTSVTMATGESSSVSSHEILERFPRSGRFRIWYSYSNRPKATYVEGSRPHDGVAFFDVETAGGFDRITGSYYTDRRTTGDIALERVSE